MVLRSNTNNQKLTTQFASSSPLMRGSLIEFTISHDATASNSVKKRKMIILQEKLVKLDFAVSTARRFASLPNEKPSTTTSLISSEIISRIAHAFPKK